MNQICILCTDLFILYVRTHDQEWKIFTFWNVSKMIPFWSLKLDKFWLAIFRNRNWFMYLTIQAQTTMERRTSGVWLLPLNFHISSCLFTITIERQKNFNSFATFMNTEALDPAINWNISLAYELSLQFNNQVTFESDERWMCLNFQ